MFGTFMTINIIGYIAYYGYNIIHDLYFDKSGEDVVAAHVEELELVKNHEWNFSRVGLTLLGSLSDMIALQAPYIISLIQTTAQTLRNQRTQNTALYKMFLDKKREVSTDTFVFIQLKDYYLTFDDDAIDVFSCQTGAFLYECSVFGLRGRTVALLDNSQVETMRSIHPLLVVNSKQDIPLYKLT